MDKKSSLTSFNFTPHIESQQDDEGVLSKIFVKVKSAVSGQTDTQSKPQSIVSIPHTVSTASLETNTTSDSTINHQNNPSSSSITSQKDLTMINFPATLHTEAVSRAPTTATTTTTVTVANSKTNHERIQSNNSSSVHFALPVNAGPSEEYQPEYFMNPPLTKEMSMDSDTQSVVTNFSISNSNSLSKILARLRGQKNDKEFWMPDEQCKECYKCRKPFTLLRRKHHCRTCGQIFCAKCASHVVSGKMYKQKGQVRVCNFCYAEQQHKEEEEEEERVLNNHPYKQEISSPLSKKQANDSYSAIIPSQKPPLAVPKMQIPTTAFKQTKSTYGSEDTTTFALEIPTHTDSYQNTSSPLIPNDAQIVISTNYSQNDRPPNALEPNSIINNLPAITATSTEGGFKRLLDAGTSLLKSRPRSNTSNSAPLEDTRYVVTPHGSPTPFRGGMYSPNYSGYLDKGGGTVVTESDLSGYPGNNNTTNNTDVDIGGDLEYQPYDRPANMIALNSNVRMSSNSSHRSGDDLVGEVVVGSDDDSYENRLRIKWTDERKSRERTISFPRRRSLTNSSPRMRSMRINTSCLPKSDFAQEGRSPLLSPYIGDDKFSASPDVAKSSRFRAPRQRRISGPPQTVELSTTALSHARKMLRQLMEEINLESASTSKEDWENVIMNLLLKVTNNVQPDVRSGDDMDVRHYVKIKKIPGGLPSDSFYVKGVVCTKNLVHKRMVKSISHPRILILLFSLDYSRVEMENQLLSIAPVISQEREHISKLVGRIVALKPSLLLVKSNVSRLALEFLLAANIPVIHNVKHSVIEAVARCTQATVVTSVDKLQQNVSFGRCGSFEVRTIMHEWLPNRRKTFLIFDDCAPELGGTIVLRGAKDDTLSVIKRLIDFMVFVVNNLKLETAVLRDSFAKNRGSLEEVEEQQRPTDVDEDGANTSAHYLADLIKIYRTTTLSVSQYVVFPPPYLLLTLKETEDKLMLLQQYRRKSITSFKDLPLSASPTRSTFEKQSISSEVPSRSTEEGLDAEYDLMAKHHQIARAWEAYIGENPESVRPFFHQNIVVLYSSVCTVTTVPCRGPEIRIFSFYRFPSDKTLGQYIMDLCADAHQPCMSMMCDHPMLQHYRSYAHGDARVNVMIESFDCPLPGMSDKLLMWSYCRECNKPTPVLPMSENTWNYSFGKFLEIFLYQKGVHCRADICPHDMVRHHVRYFGYMNLAVRFQYDPIELLEVMPPPMKLFILSKVQMDLKEEELRILRQKINKFYQSIAERNKSFPFDLVDPRKLETCKAELQEMSLEAQGEKKDALQLVQNVYANSDPNDTLSMNWVRRKLFQLVARWEAVYNDFVRYYLQPERELKKITASHLRKMFPADFSDAAILSLDNERTKRATEVGDLPLVGISLDGDTDDTLVDRREKNGVDVDRSPVLLPVLSSTPSDNSFDDLTLSSGKPGSSNLDNKPTFLRPEIRRRFSLDLMHELNEKLKSRENADSSNHNRRSASKFMRVKGSGTPPAAYTPSRIPVPLISNNKGPGTPMHDNYKPPHLSTNESPRNMIKMESRVASPQSGFRGHRRYNSIGHTQDLEKSLFDEVKNSFYGAELSSSYIGQGVTSRDRRFRSKLPRKKTYIQVYTRANELVQEDIEDEFHPYHSPDHKKKNKSRNIPIQKPKNHRYMTYSDRVFPFHDDDGDDADCDSDNDGKDDSETEMDYFSPMAPYARNVIEPKTAPPELPVEDKPESSQGSFSRPYFPFSDGQLDMSGEDDTDRDLPLASDLLKAQQLDDKSIGDLHNIHPDLIQSNANDISINLSLSDTLDESRHSPEMSSFMKTLTNFLPDSGVRNLLPLELPLLPTEHIFPDSCVVVREDEPSTIIAYTLSSEDYIEKMHDIQENGSGSNSDTVKAAEKISPSEITALDTTVQVPVPPADIQETLLRESGTHMRYNFSTGSTKFFCKIFFSEQFDALRRNCGCSESYIMSLAKCIKWDASGGKSGSAFVKTKDDRLLMKQMSKYELDAFLGFAPSYFHYMSEAFFSELPTVLAKIFGFYSIGYKNSTTGKSMRMDVLVMENLFYQRNVKKIFDLKGSMRNRHVQSTGKQDEVLLDENLVELIYQSPLFIRAYSKDILRSSLHNDTLFLSNSNIMDYSLLVGIDEQRQELVVGIVDFIRTFTWDKKLESWVKESGILGGGGKEPTIVSPRQYRIRFREAMERYFLMVPDCWVLNRQNSTVYSALHHHPSISDEEF